MKHITYVVEITKRGTAQQFAHTFMDDDCSSYDSPEAYFYEIHKLFFAPDTTWMIVDEVESETAEPIADPRDEQFRAELQRQAENNLGGIDYQPSVAEHHRRKIAKADANMPDAMLGVMDSSGEASALRRLQNKNGNYRGWNVYPMARGYGIRKQGHQGYANFKTVQAAMAKIDAIVG